MPGLDSYHHTLDYTPRYEYSFDPISPNPHHRVVAGFAGARFCTTVEHERVPSL